MAGRQTFRMLIVDKSGSGKSTLAREVIRAMQGRYTVGEDGDPWPAIKKHLGLHVSD